MRTLTIGRHPSCEIHIDAPEVSRLHARLIAGEDGWVVEDLLSANGTTVNGTPIQRCRLKSCDDLRVAGTQVNWERVLTSADALPNPNASVAPALVCSNLTLHGAAGSGSPYRLREVSFALKTGQLVAIIGPSGAGKTTLLRVLTGALAPSAGLVLVHGDNLHLDPDRVCLRLGYVPQDDIVHRELVLHDALVYAAQLRVVPPETLTETEQRVCKVAITCGLHSHLHKRIRDLSGGERKRASIAVELLTSPGIMYFDEPTSGLDPALERTFMQLARQLANEGRVIAVTTHTTRSIELCDLVLIMAPGGQMIYFGPPKYICQHFGVPDVADVYQLLALGPEAPTQLAQRFRASRIYQRYVVQPLLAAAAETHDTVSPPSLVPPWTQAGVLLRRQLALLLGDPVNTGILLLQAPLIAAIIALVFPGDSFTSQSHLKHSSAVIFMLVISGIWFGVSNSAREIVKERAVYRRERVAGLDRSAYLISKLLPLAGLSAIQTLVLLLIVGAVMSWFDIGDSASVLTLWVLLWLAALSGATLGLVLSALARSTDQAVSLTPVVLLPQVVFSGIFSAIENSNEGLRALARCMSSNWCFGAAGHVANLNDKLSSIGSGSSVFDRIPSVGIGALLILTVLTSSVAFLMLRLGERR
ncbi:ABC transporter permease [bacterium]|nr:ABC transporter permease [bacterium]